jgi:hypothetical protein
MIALVESKADAALACQACPYLALANDKTTYQPRMSTENRCLAARQPVPVSDTTQRDRCLGGQFHLCTHLIRARYLESLVATQATQPTSRWDRVRNLFR